MLLAQGMSPAATAQENERLVRLAKLVIDSTQLKQYQGYLKEEIETSLWSRVC